MLREQIYPGDVASPSQILELADEYSKAAMVLYPLGAKRKPLTRAPMRLITIHAIELYLNALLLSRGHSAAEVRGLQHDLGRRTDLASDCGLQLRKRTAEHLRSMGEQREYLITRYGPELAATASQINRLRATLVEVSKKVSIMIRADNSNASDRRVPCPQSGR